MYPPECLGLTMFYLGSWYQSCKSWGGKLNTRHEELLSRDGCLTPFLGDFLLDPMLTKKNQGTAIIILAASSLLCDCFEERQRENPVISLIHCHPNNTHRPIFIVSLLQSRCCLSENWSARENTKHPSWGRRGTNTRCGPSFPLLVSGVAISVCDPLASVGGAGLGEGNIHNYFSASHNLWQGSVLVCCVLEAHSALCNQSPNWLTTHFVRIH